MSISRSLSIAGSGLSANARLAEIVSANIANALTEGYARRTVALSSAAQEGGVRITGILRQTDTSLIADRRLAQAGAGIGAAGHLQAGEIGLEQVALGAARPAAGLGDLAGVLGGGGKGRRQHGQAGEKGDQSHGAGVSQWRSVTMGQQA